MQDRFSKQVFSSRITIHNTEPKSYKEITNQFLLYNKSLKINKKCILPTFFKGTDPRNISNITLLNLLSPQNTFVNIVDFNEYNQTNINVDEYKALYPPFMEENFHTK